MGPLVPDVIGNELNLVVALFIGFLFGMILEQAGFSSSKKLVGLFYGYDFTVLRVFFTAGVVAMTGVIALDHFGLLDINLIYINPTYLWSAIIGGLIMGLGFVVGGYCPGTSISAAAIGKTDAWVFIAGSFLGVLIFSEGYPLFEGLYKSAFWGYPRIFNTLGVSQSIFAFLLTLMSLFAFWSVSIVEDKVNGVKNKAIRFTPYYISLAAIGLLLAVSVLFLPDRKESMLQQVADADPARFKNLPGMTVDELAYRIMDQDNKLQIIDFRAATEFKKYSLPKSVSFTAEDLFSKESGKLLSIQHKINVFVAEDEATEQKMTQLAKNLGFENIRFLQGGLAGFKQQIIDFKPATAPPQSMDEQFTLRFRTRASRIIPVLIAENKSTAPVQKKAKRALGGC
jgi:rhodanese-related sulfurtransferase